MNRLEKLREWEAQQPKDPFLKYAIAQELSGAGNDNEASKYYVVLIQDFSDYLPTYYQAGKCWERNGDKLKALAAYKAGIELAQKVGDNKTVRELEEAINLMNDE